jgi:hypothetical protein
VAGILDPKQRVLDTLITNEGRRQASSGRMRIEYVSFSDASAIYALDTLVSGGLDYTSRLTFEAGNLPQDAITFEVDDSGKLLTNFITSGTQYSVAAGQIYSGSNYEIVSSSQFASLYNDLLGSTLDNFKKLSILQSPDPVFAAYSNFIVNTENIRYTITPSFPIPRTEIQEVNIDNVESLFFDKRLSHVSNFQFLPPVNDGINGANNQSGVIGDYINLNQASLISYQDLERELEVLKLNGFMQTIEFLSKSRDNNLFCQFFESHGNEITKLDVIDFGEFPATENAGSRHVFFVGKVFTDGYNITTFVNLFVLIFEQ